MKLILSLLVILFTCLLTVPSVYAAQTFSIDPPLCSIGLDPGITTVTAGTSTNINVTGAVTLFSISLNSNPALTGLPTSKNTQPLFPFTYTWAVPTLGITHTFTANVVDSVSGNGGSCAQTYTPVADPASTTPVDGGWSNWGPLNCSSNCSNEEQKRYCTAPEPTNGGLECLMEDNITRAMIETKPCGTQVCITPWIQVTGDVHSNTRIKAPGGP